MKLLNKKLGLSAFTLIELVISISIFMVFLAIAGNSYSSLTTANRRANEFQKVYREIRFITDTLGQEIKSGGLDYGCIGDIPIVDPLCVENNEGTSKKVLAILHEKGLKRDIFKFADKKILIAHQSRPKEDEHWQTIRPWESLTSEKFPLEDFSVSVFPDKDPYAEENAGNENVQWQPSVKIKMKGKNFDLQFTYSLRNYGKKSLYEPS